MTTTALRQDLFQYDLRKVVAAEAFEAGLCEGFLNFNSVLKFSYKTPFMAEGTLCHRVTHEQQKICDEFQFTVWTSDMLLL